MKGDPTYQGDLESTDQVQQLLAQDGLSHDNGSLDRALQSEASDARTLADPSSCLLLEDIDLVTSGAHASPAVRRCAHNAIDALVPNIVTEDTAVAWSTFGWDAYRASGGFPRFRSVPWQVSSVPSIDAASSAVTTAAAGLMPNPFSWVPLAPLAGVVSSPQLVPSFMIFALATLAYLDLGGNLSRGQRLVVNAQIDASRGCPGFSTLNRATVADATSCDLETTLIVLRLNSALADPTTSTAVGK